MKTHELTKEWLVAHNVEVIGTDIYYTGPKGRRKLHQSVIKGPSKLGKPKEYKAVFVYLPETQKQKLLLVHRIIFAWYNGVAHKGLTIDHINNNPNDNRYENLRELSIQDNLGIRESKGHNNHIYYGMKGLTNNQVDELKDNYRLFHNYIDTELKNRRDARNMISWHRCEIYNSREKDDYLEIKARHLEAIEELTRYVDRSLKECKENDKRFKEYKKSLLGE